MSDLDHLLDGYDARKKSEKEADEQKLSQEKDLRDKTVEVLKTIILPVLNEMSTVVQQRGHECKIIEANETSSTPDVKLLFTPLYKDRDNFTRPHLSGLSFTHTPNGRIEVHQEFNVKGQQRSHKTELRLSDVTTDKVRSEVLSFLETVLNAN